MLFSGYSSTSLNRWRGSCDVRSRPHMLVFRCSHAWARPSRHVFVSYSEPRAVTGSRCPGVELLAAHSLPTPASLQMMTLTLGSRQWCNQRSCCQKQPTFYSPQQAWLAWLLQRYAEKSIEKNYSTWLCYWPLRCLNRKPDGDIISLNVAFVLQSRLLKSLSGRLQYSELRKSRSQSRKVYEEFIWKNCAKDPEATPCLLSIPSSIPPPSPLTLQPVFVVKMCKHNMLIPAGLVEVGYSSEPLLD